MSATKKIQVSPRKTRKAEQIEEIPESKVSAINNPYISDPSNIRALEALYRSKYNKNAGNGLDFFEAVERSKELGRHVIYAANTVREAAKLAPGVGLAVPDITKEVTTGKASVLNKRALSAYINGYLNAITSNIVKNTQTVSGIKQKLHLTSFTSAGVAALNKAKILLGENAVTVNDLFPVEDVKFVAGLLIKKNRTSGGEAEAISFIDLKKYNLQVKSLYEKASSTATSINLATVVRFSNNKQSSINRAKDSLEQGGWFEGLERGAEARAVQAVEEKAELEGKDLTKLTEDAYRALVRKVLNVEAQANEVAKYVFYKSRGAELVKNVEDGTRALVRRSDKKLYSFKSKGVSPRGSRKLRSSSGSSGSTKKTKSRSPSPAK